MSKPTIAIIGGGAAALLFASEVDTTKYSVTIYEKNKGLGRKFLVAGKGGFNLTHASDVETMKSKYVASPSVLKAIDSFNNQDFIDWLKKEGVETFVGSSKRIFPVKPIKPIEVLKAFEDKIKANGVEIKYGHTWKGFSENGLLFETTKGEKTINPDKVVFALGGASWTVTGSAGDWLSLFENKGIKTFPFSPSNCGVEIIWKEKFAKQNEGLPLKSIAVSCGDLSKKGDVTITKLGLEGSAVYALSPAIRNQIKENGEAIVYLDLKPTTNTEALIRKMKSPRKKNSWSEHLIWQLKLSKSMFDLLKRSCSKEEFTNVNFMATHIKKIPLTVVGFDDIEKAISTVGGIDLSEIDENFEFKNLPNHMEINAKIPICKTLCMLV